MRGAPRSLFMTIGGTNPEYVDFDRYRTLLDGTVAAGVRGVRFMLPWRVVCATCASGLVDLDTEPRAGEYEFSSLFRRADEAASRGLRIIVSIRFEGRLDSAPRAKGPQATLPAGLSAQDVAVCRGPSGVDEVYARGEVHVIRFLEPEVRRRVLAYAEALTRALRDRYGDSLEYVSFGFNSVAENEYPLVGAGHICDTSIDARRAFLEWLRLAYGEPAAVSRAWGRAEAFREWSEIEILDGEAPPAPGSSSRAYLDFAAFREDELARFLSELRDRVHAAGGRIMAQYGSGWDLAASTRGTYGFGRQALGFDLVVFDDAPGYDHDFSMAYLRGNTSAPGGTEVDSICLLGCASGDVSSCCDRSAFPRHIDPEVARERLLRQIRGAYQGGAAFAGLANWDPFVPEAFAVVSAALAESVELASVASTDPVPSTTLTVSLRELYDNHGSPEFLDALIRRYHDARSSGESAAVRVVYDLPTSQLDLRDDAPSQPEASAGSASSPSRPWPRLQRPQRR